MLFIYLFILLSITNIVLKKKLKKENYKYYFLIHSFDILEEVKTC